MQDFSVPRPKNGTGNNTYWENEKLEAKGQVIPRILIRSTAFILKIASMVEENQRIQGF